MFTPVERFGLAAASLKRLSMASFSLEDFFVLITFETLLDHCKWYWAMIWRAGFQSYVCVLRACKAEAHAHEQMDGMKHISHCSTDLQVVITCQEKWQGIINAVKRADAWRSPNLWKFSYYNCSVSMSIRRQGDTQYFLVKRNEFQLHVVSLKNLSLFKNKASVKKKQPWDTLV